MVLAVFDVTALLKLIVFLFSLISIEANTISALMLPLALVFGFSALAFLVFTYEYHARHFGTPASKSCWSIPSAHKWRSWLPSGC